MTREFGIQQFYREFIKYTTKARLEFVEKFHSNCNEINTLSIELDEYYHYLVKFKVSNKVIQTLENPKKIKIETLDLEETLFIAKYNEYVNLIKENQLLKNRIQKYDIFSNLNSVHYSIILRNINHEVSKLLLKGYSFPYPIIGTIYVTRVPYNSSIPDWHRSLQFKQTLVDNNIELRTKDNPTGANWLVDNGLGREDFIVVKWRKRHGRLPNKEIYKFTPQFMKNCWALQPENKNATLEETINSGTTGIFDRIMFIYRNFYDYAVKTYSFYNPVKKAKL